MLRFVIIALIMSACIGTDIVDDPIVGKQIVIRNSVESLLIGQSVIIDAIYTNEYGVPENVIYQYEISDESIVSVEDETVTALSKGQSTITLVYEEVRSEPMLVTVLESLSDISSVTITASSELLPIGNSLELGLEVFDGNGNSVEPMNVQWSSSDESIIEVDQNGTATGISLGNANITATVDGIISAPLEMEVVISENLTATFSGANGYDAAGEVTVFEEDGRWIMELGDNFSTDFALGTFIYLSNSTSGRETRSRGIEVSEVVNGGFHSFDLTEIDASIDPTSFRYVIVLCKPASITFGIADFENP